MVATTLGFLSLLDWTTRVHAYAASVNCIGEALKGVLGKKVTQSLSTLVTTGQVAKQHVKVPQKAKRVHSYDALPRGSSVPLSKTALILNRIKVQKETSAKKLRAEHVNIEVKCQVLLEQLGFQKCEVAVCAVGSVCRSEPSQFNIYMQHSSVRYRIRLPQ